MRSPLVSQIACVLDLRATHSYNACMRRSKNRQYTIRAVPPALDSALREQARREGKSLNQVALEALRRGLGVDTPAVEFHDLDHVIGTWVDDPEFDAAIAEQDRVDEDLWR